MTYKKTTRRCQPINFNKWSLDIYLMNEPLAETSEHSLPVLHESKSKEHLALKLNGLKEKSTRYESHKDFLSR